MARRTVPRDMRVRINVNLRRDIAAEARIAELYRAHPRPQEWIRQMILAGIALTEGGAAPPPPVPKPVPAAAAAVAALGVSDRQAAPAAAAPPPSPPQAPAAPGEGTGHGLVDSLLDLGGG